LTSLSTSHTCTSNCTGFAFCKRTKLSSTQIAQTEAYHNTETQHRSGSLGQEKDMVLIKSLLTTTPLCLTLCLLYPSHPSAFPNTHSFPSNSPTPQTFLFPTTKCPTKVVRGWRSFQGHFLSRFPLFLLVITIYHWIKKFF
jgi:hypothetical protein